MKQFKKVWYLLSTLLLTLPLFTGLVGTVPAFAAENDDTAKVILHKKKMTDFPDPLIQNSGKEMSEFDQYQGLAGVTFSIYDVTAEFYAQREAGATVDAAKQAVQGLTTGTPIAQGTTDANGNVSLDLPRNNKVKMQFIPSKKKQKMA